MDATISQLERAVVALAERRVADALAALRAIDYSALVAARLAAHAQARATRRAVAAPLMPFPGAKRLSVRKGDVRATFERDRYTCRYAHCGRQTVDLDVLKLLSRAVPEIIPYHSNWRPVDRHILYWSYSTSVEHAVSFPLGGTSAPENILTACYLCNDVKKQSPADLLGWIVGPPCDSEWRGLTEYLVHLRQAVAELTADVADA